VAAVVTPVARIAAPTTAATVLPLVLRITATRIASPSTPAAPRGRRSEKSITPQVIAPGKDRKVRIGAVGSAT
jgi:hypothetical protein